MGSVCVLEAPTGALPRRAVVKRDACVAEGRSLRDVELAGFILGPELGTAPVVVVIGGITASPFPFGNGTEAEAWWPALNAPDLIDPSRETVLSFCWPGNGSTWAGFDDDAVQKPLSALGLADLLAAWLDGIGARDPVTYVGASLGGMVGIAFASRHAERCARLVTISAGLRPDGWGTATRHLQRELIRDGIARNDVATGMARARQLGMLTYRGRDELDTRFGKLLGHLERPPVAEYLDHHGKRFADHFPVRTFLLLSEAIDRSNFGPDDTTVRAALERVTAEVLVIGVPGDMLFPYALQAELHRALQALGATSHLWKLESEFGHDAFLADQDKLARLLRDSGFFRKAPALVTSGERFVGVGIEPVRELRVGLVGCGVVGSGLLEMIEKHRQELIVRYGVRLEITRIAVRDLAKPRSALAAGKPIGTDALALVAAPDVDVVVEVAGGMAVEAVLRAALAAGKPVVTANKALLAAKLDGLAMLAERTATPLYCEAAVAAAIPIIRHLSHRSDEVDSLLGIVNGTCNYIITRLEQDELPFDDAVREAQAKGFAEADPSADVDGHDAAAKLSILAYRAFGTWALPSQFLVRGIRDLTAADCDLAETMGYRVRSLAHASRDAEGLSLAVEPMLLPAWHLLASVEEEYNAIYLKQACSGDLSLFGMGAGSLPTASAVLADLIELAQGNSVRWPEPRKTTPRSDTKARSHYLRVTADEHEGLTRRVESLMRRYGVDVLKQARRAEPDATHYGFVLSVAPKSVIEDAVSAIERLGRVKQTLVLGVTQ
ncbi:MAG: homoserine dehydrogenase [Myxococcota bacterium]